MNATDRDQLLAARRELVHRTVAESVEKLGGHLPPPDVDFGRTAGPDGRFVLKHNRVEIRGEGFLDDPSVSVARIRATVAHEVGHWADPTMASVARRTTIMLTVIGALLIAAATGVVVMSVASGQPRGVAPLLVTLLASVLVGVVLMARWCWPQEYFADRAATQVAGAEAVIEMVDAIPHRGPSPTHPRPRDRRKRLVELGGTVTA